MSYFTAVVCLRMVVVTGRRHLILSCIFGKHHWAMLFHHWLRFFVNDCTSPSLKTTSLSPHVDSFIQWKGLSCGTANTNPINGLGCGEGTVHSNVHKKQLTMMHCLLSWNSLPLPQENFSLLHKSLLSLKNIIILHGLASLVMT